MGQTKATNDKSSRLLSLWRRDDGQPDEGQNEQQQQQPANHSSDNEEIARCLTPFSHPAGNFGQRRFWGSFIVTRLKSESISKQQSGENQENNCCYLIYLIASQFFWLSRLL